MTITEIVLLSNPGDAAVLAEILRAHNPSLRTTVAPDKATLEASAGGDLSSSRMISFCTSVIVPPDVLRAFPGPSYNFHPGPPDRPGRFPSVFALYEQAPRFGVTVHEMTERVDAGPIVAAEWFPIPEDAGIETLEKMALGSLATIFRRLAPFLAMNPKPLPRIYIPWSGTKRTKAECDEICRLTPDMTAEEIERRKRACGSILS